MKALQLFAGLLLGALISLTTGCSTMFSKSQYDIHVTSEPAGARVIADGKVVGETPTVVKAKNTLNRLPVAVRLEKEGYESSELEIKFRLTGWYLGSCILLAPAIVDLISGKCWEPVQNDLYATLDKAKPPAPVAAAYPAPARSVPSSTPQQQTLKEAKVAISCAIEGVDVFVDGAFVGGCPAKLSLTEGPHIIEVKKVGLGTFKRELHVLPGSDISIRAELSQ